MLEIVVLTYILVTVDPLAAEKQPFREGHEVCYIKTSVINDASGLAASRKHKDVLYTVNDFSSHRDENRVFAIDANTGNLVATLQMSGVTNNDWEDIAVGPCGNDTCVYIGDIGKTIHAPAANKIYRFREPEQLKEETIAITANDILSFRWGEPECECLMVDDIGDVFIVSRVRYGHGLMAAVPGVWGGDPVDLTNVSRIHLNTNKYDPRGCDISPDGEGMLVEAQEHMYYWQVLNRDYLTTAEEAPVIVPFHQDAAIGSGQSVAWAADGAGYYTLPEGGHPALYYYPKRYIVSHGRQV